jgi:hypothetical protein
MSATVEAAIAIVGAVRTKTLLMLVPRRMREVRVAHAARIANWSAVPFGDPGRLVAEALGQVDEVDDLSRVEPARNGDADPAHPVPPVMEPRSNIGCHLTPKYTMPGEGPRPSVSRSTCVILCGAERRVESAKLV